MSFDIPNYVTLPLEIGVALMIVLMDRRSRARDQAGMEKQQDIEIRNKEARRQQTERFNNWTQETARRQIMLLESIISALDSEKANIFKDEVGSRYTEEISKDVDDLESLLQKQKVQPKDSDLDLEIDIQSKIDEINTARQIATLFLPENIISNIENLSEIAKKSLGHVNALRENEVTISKQIKDETTEEPSVPEVDEQVKRIDDQVKEFSIGREKLHNDLMILKDEIQRSIEKTTGELTSTFRNIFKPKKLEEGIRKFVKEQTEKGSEEDDE
ncbi:MAG: hypothetical protein ACXAD7_01940 [Candidatus Kariarchaeaceae archaeon]|jgi:hypothetical protein